jgi:ribosomal protein L2
MPVTAAKVEDAIIGLFSKAQPSLKADHQCMVRVTPKGDGVFEFECYLCKRGRLTRSADCMAAIGEDSDHPPVLYTLSGKVTDLVSEVRASGRLENMDTDEKEGKTSARTSNLTTTIKSLFQGLGIKVY